MSVFMAHSTTMKQNRNIFKIGLLIYVCNTIMINKVYCTFIDHLF